VSVKQAIGVGAAEEERELAVGVVKDAVESAVDELEEDLTRKEDVVVDDDRELEEIIEEPCLGRLEELFSREVLLLPRCREE